MAGCFCKDNKECIFDVRNGCEMMRRCLMDESSQVGRIISSGIGGDDVIWWWWPLYSSMTDMRCELEPFVVHDRRGISMTSVICNSKTSSLFLG